jgi:hypothetical protein
MAFSLPRSLHYLSFLIKTPKIALPFWKLDIDYWLLDIEKTALPFWTLDIDYWILDIESSPILALL